MARVPAVIQGLRVWGITHFLFAFQILLLLLCNGFSLYRPGYPQSQRGSTCLLSVGLKAFGTIPGLSSVFYKVTQLVCFGIGIKARLIQALFSVVRRLPGP